MNEPNRRSLRAGDAVIFRACHYEVCITQEMIEVAKCSEATELSERRAAGLSVRPPASKDGFAHHVTSSLNVEAARWMLCPTCGRLGAFKLGSGFSIRDPAPRVSAAAASEEVAIESEGVFAKYSYLCRKCNGFNGLEEYCYHCGGSGYEPEPEK